MTIPAIRGSLFCDGKLRAPREGTCRNKAGYKTNHVGWGRCFMHGGSTPNHGESVAMAQAYATARLFGVPRNVDPVTGMLEVYHQTMGVLDAIEAMCVQLLPDDVVWGKIKEKRVAGEASATDGDESLTPPEVEYGAGVNIWVKLLAEWHDRAFSEAERMLKLDLTARAITFNASQVAAVVQVLLSPELGLSEDQRRAAARILRNMDATQPAIEGTIAA